MSNSLQPVTAILEKIVPMVVDNHLFSFRPEQPIDLVPGQFFEISIPGIGGFPVSSCGLVCNGLINSCIRRVGRVTDALYQLEVGDTIGMRGPFGNGFPLDLFHGNDALLIAGGLGMAPLRALLQALLDDNARKGKIVLLYGSREPDAFLFRDELVELSDQGRIDMRLSVDFAESLPGPYGRVLCKIGLVSELLADLDFNPRNTIAAVCGPPALYRCVLEELALIGMPAAKIFATLERRMRCGIGECCHCVVGGRYICKDGPVFSLEQLRKMAGAI
ncbi:MAG: FAD/NAD(P)-binding protein [Desulfuromonadales bacterium]|nr:FAD/NAD(P)-binding protein [Desulfuromonadales bacterium]